MALALTLEETRLEAERCVACPLHSTRTHVVFGSGDVDAALMLVGEAPGKDEDDAGLPFVGRSGQLVIRLLEETFGLSREQCYIANVVKCRPPANRNPTAAEIARCRPFLERQIKLVSPFLVMTLGNVATRALLSTSHGISTLHGQPVDCGHYVVLPTYHPAAALRSGERILDLMRADFRLGAKILDGQAHT